MIEMNILTHDEAKRLSQSSTDPLEVIRNVEVAVVVKLAGMQNALKDEIRLIWQPKCDALRQQLEAAQPERAPLTDAEISKLVMPYGFSSIQGFDHIKAYTRRVEAYIKQGGQHD